MLLVCVGSLRYPECNAHAPYCHLWPVRLYSIFHIISQTAQISGGGGGGVTEHKMRVLIFSINFV